MVESMDNFIYDNSTLLFFLILGILIVVEMVSSFRNRKKKKIEENRRKYIENVVNQAVENPEIQDILKVQAEEAEMAQATEIDQAIALRKDKDAMNKINDLMVEAEDNVTWIQTYARKVCLKEKYEAAEKKAATAKIVAAVEAEKYEADIERIYKKAEQAVAKTRQLVEDMKSETDWVKVLNASKEAEEAVDQAKEAVLQEIQLNKAIEEANKNAQIAQDMVNMRKVQAERAMGEMEGC